MTINSMFSAATFERVCKSREEAYDHESPDGVSLRCPRCNSERWSKNGSIVEYKCRSSLGWGFLPSKLCYSKAFEFNKAVIRELMAKNKSLEAEVKDLRAKVERGAR